MPYTSELMKSQAELAFALAGETDLTLQVTQHMIDYISFRINKFADSANDETLLQIKSTITQGIKDGESTYKLRNRISDVYFQATTIRSERIARTETIAASNEAANEAYRQSPLTVSKEWHAEPDACEFCLSMDGVVIGVEEDFVADGANITGTEDGTLHANYGSIEHPPMHPNCRCAILPVASK